MMTAILLLVLLTITTSSLLNSSSGATTFVVNGFDLNRIHHHRQVIVSLGRTTTTRISSLGRQRQRRVGNCVELCSNSIGELGEDKNRISQSTSVALLSSSIISVRGGSSSSSSSEAVIAPSKKGKRQLIPIGVAIIIGSFSILEIIESLREETERYFGHAHGILILSLIRLFRSVAILQTEVVEFEEAAEKLFNQGEVDKTESGRKKKRRSSSLSTIIGKFIVSRKVSIAACIMASIASLVEVYDDLKPGGHHGAVFLAFSELNYQLNRCHDIRTPSKRKEDADKKNRTIQSKSSSLTWKRFIGPTLFIAAAIFAAYELYEDIKPGAHHAVAVLALAELVENINRSKVLKKLNNNGGRS